jgi:transglutaminase/protease-like cytokinesis protein 3
MSKHISGDHSGVATVSFLPIIDLNPNDLSCIYSVLMFVINQAEILQIRTPVLTFDQPLWLKATEIATAKSLSIVLILGGFHMMMSFFWEV